MHDGSVYHFAKFTFKHAGKIYFQIFLPNLTYDLNEPPCSMQVESYRYYQA